MPSQSLAPQLVNLMMARSKEPEICWSYCMTWKSNWRIEMVWRRRGRTEERRTEWKKRSGWKGRQGRRTVRRIGQSVERSERRGRPEKERSTEWVRRNRKIVDCQEPDPEICGTANLRKQFSTSVSCCWHLMLVCFMKVFLAIWTMFGNTCLKILLLLAYREITASCTMWNVDLPGDCCIAVLLLESTGCQHAYFRYSLGAGCAFGYLSSGFHTRILTDQLRVDPGDGIVAVYEIHRSQCYSLPYDPGWSYSWAWPGLWSDLLLAGVYL